MIDGACRCEFRANGGNIDIGDKVDGACQLYLYAKGSIHIRGKVDNGNTQIYWWGSSMSVDGGVNGGATVQQKNWGNFV